MYPIPKGHAISQHKVKGEKRGTFLSRQLSFSICSRSSILFLFFPPFTKIIFFFWGDDKKEREKKGKEGRKGSGKREKSSFFDMFCNSEHEDEAAAASRGRPRSFFRSGRDRGRKKGLNFQEEEEVTEEESRIFPFEWNRKGKGRGKGKQYKKNMPHWFIRPITTSFLWCFLFFFFFRRMKIPRRFPRPRTKLRSRWFVSFSSSSSSQAKHAAAAEKRLSFFHSFPFSFHLPMLEAICYLQHENDMNNTTTQGLCERNERRWTTDDRPKPIEKKNQ